MAHFCEIKTDDNKVIRTVVISNSDVDANGGDLSASAETWVANNIPPDPNIKEELGGVYPNTYWKQTSYNNNFRQVYAGPGYTYDSSIDKFIPEKTYDNWVWDEENWRWKPPIDVPTDENGPYEWDQENSQWNSIKGL
tara:strand:+ start:1187 stop:1600 length:414 start_codon:yes stop_codon:yes gene_type:complete